MSYESVGKVVELVIERIGDAIEKYASVDYLHIRTGEIEARTGLSRVTVYRILKMLEEAGFLENRGKTWNLSERMIKLFDEYHRRRTEREQAISKIKL